VRIHAAKDGEYADRRDAKAEIFSARSGWIDYPTAQEKILMDGELFMIDDSEVPDRTWLSRAGGSMCV
jgi:hypothetical protein